MLMAFLTRPFMKWIGIGLLALLVIGFAVHKWNNFTESLIEEGRVLGFKECQDAVNKKIAENDRVNRKVEERVGSELDGFEKELNKIRDGRINKETIINNRVEKSISDSPEVFNNPDCVVPQDVIDGRNAIRNLGPKGVE